MDYTKIPETLLYKRKSVDKLAMLHPLNTELFKRLMKMDGWNGECSREQQVLPCLNNAYYICTIMRLEYDVTFREDSYKGIARSGFTEGRNTLAECVTLSLVAVLIEHSTPKWHQKLQEIADNLRRYASSLYDERELSLMGYPDSKYIDVVHLIGIPTFLSKDLDDSWVLPDELFQPRALDDKAIFDLHRQDPTFNWDKYYYHHDEEDFSEMVEKLGQTQSEKAILIRSFWKDIYNSRREYDGPIKETWLFLKALAQEFCPDFMETTELHKIPQTGIEFEKRISELEAEVASLKQQNDNSEATAENSEGETIAGFKAEIERLNEEIRKRDTESNQVWIGCFDLFLHQNLNAEAIAEELRNISSPHLPKNERGFWWTVFTVFSEIHWIPKPSNSQKMLLQWANLHFDCGWDWRKENQFKFSDINDKIKTLSSNDWNKHKIGNVYGDYYGELAKSIKNAFVEIVEGRIIDRSKFILPVCRRINNVRK